MGLFVNNILRRDTPEGEILECDRILWIDRAKDVVVTISIIDANGLPQYRILSELLNELYKLN